ncbi:hypothetical protein GCM10011351_02450 [Paraliobacillus quinghaiensis]|uniref:Uncharacterized protein n=1 Tax=Paraliobacillus quinghaiensis TaxID=470815 RepID=A0A917TEE4_9BACI|nr:hypothetical protein [Paraliobacillus quinghaiensis]GGM20110.1 hypothetical protein GCM10011351_02450 [Paraliobacillus quinghaiensis]
MQIVELFINDRSIVGFTWFKKVQLYSLGLEDQQINYLIGLFCIGVLFIVVHPLIVFLVGLEWKHLLTFLITILIFSNIVALGYLYRTVNGSGMKGFSEMTFILLDIVSLGIILAIVLLANSIVAYLKQHKSNSN